MLNELFILTEKAPKWPGYHLNNVFYIREKLDSADISDLDTSGANIFIAADGRRLTVTINALNNFPRDQ